jgi:putative tryptophan/tyrosine transport system substrate-binding protein
MREANTARFALRRREAIALIGGAAAWPLGARAQTPFKSPRVGILRPGTLADASLDAFRRELRQFGYVDGENMHLDYRVADGNVHLLPTLASELVNLNVDVVVAEHSSAIQAAKQATRTIPIVMAASADPVGAGLVASLARPGGNVTGLSRLAPEADEKRLQLIKEALPNVTRVAFIWDPTNPGLAIRFKAEQSAAGALGLAIQSVELRTPDKLQSALESAAREDAGAMIVPAPMIGAYRALVSDFAKKNRLPLILDTREFVDDPGVLLSYGSSLPEMWRRAAIYVDKILKGAKPADLPVEQPTKFELVINLKTAKSLDLDIPPTLLARADEVIE